MTQRDCDVEGASKRRYLGLRAPYLAAETRALRQRAAGAQIERPAPLAFVERGRGGWRVAAFDAAAQAHGLRAGMALPEARALAPALEALPARPEEDARRLLELCDWCRRFTPLVALDAPDGLILDVTDRIAAFEGEAALAASVVAAFAALGLTARVALADTPEAARALARFAEVALDPPDVATRALPVAALEAGTEVEVALMRAGRSTIGDLLALPPRALAARIGLAAMARLERLAGRDDGAFSPARPAPDVYVDHRPPTPLHDAPALEAAAQALIAVAAERLGRLGLGGRSFEVIFFGVDGRARSVAFESPTPARGAARISRLFGRRWALEREPLARGPGVNALALLVRGVERAAAPCLLEDARERRGDEADLATCGGPAAVGWSFDGDERATASAFWPDREAAEPRGRDVGRSASNGGRAGRGAGAKRRGGRMAGRPENAAGTARGPRLLDPPEPIEIEAPTPDAPPRRFRWRRVWRSVVQVEGPETAAQDGAGEGETAPARDYFRLVDVEGRGFWVFREEVGGSSGASARWRLHAAPA